MPTVREFYIEPRFSHRAKEIYQAVVGGDVFGGGFTFFQIGPNGALRECRHVLVFLRFTTIFGGTWEARLFTRTDLTQAPNYHQIVNAQNVSGVTTAGNFELTANLESGVNTLFGETLLLGLNALGGANEALFKADAILYN